MKRSIATILMLAALAFPALAVAGADHKVTICHVPPGNPENAHAITIDEHALKAHLGENDEGLHGGDSYGPCNTPTPSPTPTATSTSEPSPSASSTATPTPSTPSATPTPAPTASPPPTPSPTETPAPTDEPTETPTCDLPEGCLKPTLPPTDTE